MKTNKILSISIAAYNVDKYISDTLDSILASKYKDEIEIIVTNDGSKDSTGEIISKYKEKFPNIVNYIKQENSGAGSTVNNGIKYANGRYFKMVDGDDWVKTENLDKLIEYLKITDCDVVVSNFDYFYENDKKYKRGISYNLENSKIFKFEDVCNKIDVATSTATYKTNILQNNKVEVSKRFYSDYQFQLYPIPFITTISYLDLDVYVYRIGREGQSISIKGYQNHIDDHQKVLFQLIDYYEKYKEKCSKNVKEYLLKKISSFIYVDINVLLSFKTSKENKNKIIETMKKIEKNSVDIFKFAKSKKIVGILVKSNYKVYSIMSIIKRIKNKC